MGQVYIAHYDDDHFAIYGYESYFEKVCSSEQSAKEFLLDGLLSWIYHHYDIEYESVEQMLVSEDDNIYWDEQQLIRLDEDGCEEFKGFYEQIEID